MVEIYLQTLVQDAANHLGVSLSLNEIVIETSKDSAHGDYATNIAMQLARPLKKSPRAIAELLLPHLQTHNIAKIEIAGPGFINFFLSPTYLGSFLQTIISEGKDYGKGSPKEERINIEFVSANPTGRLHLGHARGAALGDTMARLYEKAGHEVTREFYVNDAGVQINNLGASLYVRYLNLFGYEKELPADGYFSLDLVTIATKIKEEIGDKYVEESEEGTIFFRKRGSTLFLEMIRDDLKEYGVIFDKYSFETKIKENDAINKVLAKLKPYTYEEGGALFLKTSEFGDDKDRVIIKSNGDYTYFLPDIAYHLDKMSRGFTKLINLFGADHHGYIGRMKAALQMFGYAPDVLDVEIIQMVRIIKDGEEMKMSKRTGNAITLNDLMEDVGVDAARYFFVSKSGSSHFDFDLDLAASATSANPLYYAKYAHARLSTVLERGKIYGIDESGTKLQESAEIDLIKQLIAFTDAVKDAALSREPYKMTNYIQKLSSDIHHFYTECRILDESEPALTKARLGLARASQIVLQNALTLIGVSAPHSM